MTGDLLDTCTFIWLCAQPEELSPTAREAIDAAGELPQYHRDPFDLLLIATAIDLDATILTPDSAIHKYPVSYRW